MRRRGGLGPRRRSLPAGLVCEPAAHHAGVMQVWRGMAAWITAAGGVSVLTACVQEPSAAPARGVLVIAIDALRFDHLGIYGYDRKTSPALDELARSGVWFTNAYAAGPWQIPAHMGLLSGADPALAQRRLPAGVPASQSTLWHLPDQAPHPAVEFLSAGFSTAVFYDHPNLSPVHGTTRGFELYQGPIQDEDSTRPDFGAEAVFRRFSQWLGRLPTRRSWFAYLQLADLERVWSEVDPRWDTHFQPRASLSAVPPVGEAPRLFFALPRSKWSLGISTLGEYEARYDGAIAQLDQAFRMLRTRLELEGRLENTTIVVVGAYGMSFGESGMILDSGTFSDVDLHVPLIVRPARGIPARIGQASSALVSTLDLMPTLLELSKVTAPGGMDGLSFARALDGDEGDPRRVLHASCALQEGFAVIDKQFCFERIWPGRVLDSRLRESWFGDSERRLDLVRDAFHERGKNADLGHLDTPPSDSPIARKLAEEGRLWYERVEARRAALQGEPLPDSNATVDPSGGR